MKKIIHGRKYDTDTAKLLGEYSNGLSYSDFSHCLEYLYRKKTGEFFLYGIGGPMSKYAVSEGNNSWSGGDDISPLTYDAARQWAEEHLSADEYEEIFGEVTEDDTKTGMNVSVTVTALETAKRAAAQSGVGLGEYIESLIMAAK